MLERDSTEQPTFWHTGEPTRKCTDCHKTKPVDEFTLTQKRGKPYRMRKCKECMNARAKKWHAENKERSIQNGKRYRIENADKVKEKNRQWRKENSEKRKADNKKWHQDNPEKAKERNRRTNLRRKFSLSVDAYEKLLAEQGGVCAICKRPETHKRGGIIKALAVDHDHKTGKIRRLLCCMCNLILGHANDDVNILKACIAYLESYQSSTNGQTS